MDSLANPSANPPFPEDVPTHPLEVINYKLLLGKDQAEIQKFWTACKTLGFFYLSEHEIQANEIFEIGRHSLRNLPQKEKLNFLHNANAGDSFGYKPPGANLTNASGGVDTVEWWNIAKDDVLSYPQIAYRTYAAPINDAMDKLKDFVDKSESVSRTLLQILNEMLRLPEGFLDSCHIASKPSTSEVTLIRNPGREKAPSFSEEQLAIGAHTDFGSISLLHNVLGGLQVLPPSTKEWIYIKPIDGHIICNLGDALSVFSGGLLRSNLHRVIPQPGAQIHWDRWTLVYFFRPHGICEMRPLIESEIIKSAAEESTNSFPHGISAVEWFQRRTKYFHKDEETSAAESWKQAKGTEHSEF
ncbi:Clavaminate synthase-like protein [Lentinula boryana]|uniref:Clavaminate synthase-like protein n=1 Tax=Lentinula boryana TaxID=40481 RepID=A0ABQ8Q4N1_9AGAR|nr:Clavaminate synthase-like protein [Lentinula boryana]